jgi:hypothetical protein
MSEVDLNEIFLKSDDEKIDLEDSPINTTDDEKPVEKPVEKPKRGRKKGTISEEQRAKMLENLKKGREKKKRNLLKVKQDKIDKENDTINELKFLREEIAKLKSGRSEPVKIEKKEQKVEKLIQVLETPQLIERTKPVEKPVEKPVIKDQVINLIPPKPSPQPKIIYHGFNPNKRRY